MDTPRFRATALFVSLAMLTATGLALAPPASAVEQDIDQRDCVHNEDREDDVVLELCYGLQAQIDAPTNILTVPFVETTPDEVTIDESQTVDQEACLTDCTTVEKEENETVDEEVCLTDCTTVEEEVGVNQTIPILVPETVKLAEVDVVNIRDVEFDVGADGTRADVHPDRACEDNGFEEGCPGPEELPGPGDLPDPSDLLEEISRPGSSGSSGPAITHLADADQEGTFDGVILDPTPNAEDTGYYVGFEDLV